jgi:hypothetical protein
VLEWLLENRQAMPGIWKSSQLARDTRSKRAERKTSLGGSIPSASTNL